MPLAGPAMERFQSFKFVTVTHGLKNNNPATQYVKGHRAVVSLCTAAHELTAAYDSQMYFCSSGIYRTFSPKGLEQNCIAST